jgi:DNA polymerase-1
MAVVVPELDDASPDDQGSGDFERDESFPDGYTNDNDNGYGSYGNNSGGGYAEKPQTEEAVINPFPFPAPTFAYTENGNTLESSSDVGVGGSRGGSGGGSSFTSNRNEYNNSPPYQNSNAERTTSWSASKNSTPWNEKRFDSNSSSSNRFGSTSSTAENSVVGNRNDDTPTPPATNTKYLYSNNDDAEVRAMSTIVANVEEELSAPPEQQEQQQEQEQSPPTPMSIIDEADRASFDPFSSNSAPIKPLVAPLKLSSKSDTTANAYAAEAIATAATTNTNSNSNTNRNSNTATAAAAVPSIEGNAFDDLVVSLQGELKSVEREIETMAPPLDGKKPVNLNSPKQVSRLLFGQPDMSTNKETLEGMAGSNILAKLVLEYRDIKRRLNRVLKQQQSRDASNNDEADANNSSNNSNNQDSSNLESSFPTRAMKDPVLLFDTSSFIFRAYYSTPPIHRGSDGMPIGAVMGFCSMLNKLMLTSMLKGETPLLVHCLDAPGKSFRSDMYPEYKAHRPPCPLDLVPQFDLINKAARAYGMIQIQAVGFEADDVIATLATIGSQQEGLDVKILSGDKDLMQLVTEDDDVNDDDTNHHEGSTGMVHMVDPMTQKVWTHEKVMEKWGVTSSQLGDVLALAGDAADNIPGVPGIGPKIAAQLLQEFGTLESLLENTDQIPQVKRREKLETNVDSARISRKLVELERGLKWSQMEAFRPTSVENTDYDVTSGPTPTPLSDLTKIGDLRMQPIQVDRILAFYDDMGFRKLKNQLTERFARAQTSTDNDSGESPPEPSSKPMAVVAPIKPSKPAAAARSEKPKPKPKTASKKRNFWEKYTRGVPKPEEYEDVPF